MAEGVEDLDPAQRVRMMIEVHENLERADRAKDPQGSNGAGDMLGTQRALARVIDRFTSVPRFRGTHLVLHE